MLDEKRHLEDETLDLLLSHGIEELNNEDLAKYEAMADSMATVPTPKTDKAIKQGKHKKKWLNITRYAAFAAMMVFVLFGLHLVLYDNVEAYRFQFQRMFISYNSGAGGGGTVSVLPDDEVGDVVSLSSPAEDFPFLLWVPDGYELTLLNEYDIHKGHCAFNNGKNEEILFNYVLHENNTYGIDTSSNSSFDSEDLEMKNVRINGHEGVSISREQSGKMFHRFIWSDENYTYTLSSDLEKDTPNSYDTLFNMAKSIDYKP